MNKPQWIFATLALMTFDAAGCGGDNESSQSNAVEDKGAAGASAMPDCPETSPGDGASCQMRAQVCSYEQLECTCGAAFMGGFGETTWDCTGSGQGTRGCPGEEPKPGSACMPVFGECQYGERSCDCADSNSTWSCWLPSDCPEEAPENESACEIEAIECEYEGAECECQSSAWVCESDT